MLASIDSPQGDHVARTPAIAATVTPTTSNSSSRDKVVIRRSDQARMTGADADVLELGIDPGRVVAPLDVRGAALCRCGPRSSVVSRLGEQCAHRGPVGPGAFAG